MIDEYQKTKDWLDKYDIKNYTINEDLTVDVNGSVDINFKQISEVPFQFGKVSGDFEIGGNKLTSLQGCPKEVGRDFYCSTNNLENLQYAPNKVGRDFYCYSNKLPNLDDLPKDIGGDIVCVFKEVDYWNENPTETIDYSSNNFTDSNLYHIDQSQIKAYLAAQEHAQQLNEKLNSNLKTLDIESLHAEVQANKHNVEIPDNFIPESKPTISNKETINHEQKEVQVITQQPIKQKIMKL